MADFVLTCLDKPDALELRMRPREAHLAWVAEHPGMVRLAGPILDEAGDMAGSLFILEADGSRTRPRAFNAGDPYTRAGLFGSVEILPWRRDRRRDR